MRWPSWTPFLGTDHRAYLGVPFLSEYFIVGNAVIWDRALPPEAVALEPALWRFAAAARLAFVEIALAPVRRGLAVVLVDTLSRLEHFALPARARILDALVALLTPERAVTPAAPACRCPRSSSPATRPRPAPSAAASPRAASPGPSTPR